MNPLFRIDFSISDSLKNVRKSVLIYETIITGAIVTAEEHNVYGGLGSAVSEVIVQNFPVPVEFVGVNDCFGHSGHPAELLEKYGLTASQIVSKAHQAINRKK